MVGAVIDYGNNILAAELPIMGGERYFFSESFLYSAISSKEQSRILHSSFSV